MLATPYVHVIFTLPKVALTAAMRKLLVILNTMAKTQSPWNATLPQRP
jgi:hypothetical protein